MYKCPPEDLGNSPKTFNSQDSNSQDVIVGCNTSGGCCMKLASSAPLSII